MHHTSRCMCTTMTKEGSDDVGRSNLHRFVSHVGVQPEGDTIASAAVVKGVLTVMGAHGNDREVGLDSMPFSLIKDGREVVTDVSNQRGCQEVQVGRTAR